MTQHMLNDNDDSTMLEIGKQVLHHLSQMMQNKEKKPTNILSRCVTNFEVREKKKYWAQLQVQVVFDPLSFLDEDATYYGYVPPNVGKEIVTIHADMMRDIINYMEANKLNPDHCARIFDIIETSCYSIHNKLTDNV